MLHVPKLLKRHAAVTFASAASGVIAFDMDDKIRLAVLSCDLISSVLSSSICEESLASSIWYGFLRSESADLKSTSVIECIIAIQKKFISHDKQVAGISKLMRHRNFGNVGFEDGQLAG